VGTTGCTMDMDAGTQPRSEESQAHNWSSDTCIKAAIHIAYPLCHSLDLHSAEKKCG